MYVCLCISLDQETREGFCLITMVTKGKTVLSNFETYVMTWKRFSQCLVHTGCVASRHVSRDAAPRDALTSRDAGDATRATPGVNAAALALQQGPGGLKWFSSADANGSLAEKRSDEKVGGGRWGLCRKECWRCAGIPDKTVKIKMLVFCAETSLKKSCCISQTPVTMALSARGFCSQWKRVRRDISLIKKGASLDSSC